MNDILLEKVHKTLTSAKSVIFGQDDLLDSIIAALVCDGHLLIEGMPGLGKTLSVSTISKLCDLSFKRIQFTPDLLPSDLVGTMIYSQKSEEFTTKFGPIFTQILLADEINRSPAKVQAALLEAMAEKQVTIGDDTHKLSRPFVVLATQNPIDQEGTYPLPEAQMDRFMMKVYVDYPSFDAEKAILDLKKTYEADMESVLSTDDLISLQEVVDGIYVDDKMKDLIVRIVQATRPGSKYFNKKYEGALIAGASPRACIWLHKIGKFMAFLDGKDYVAPEHILKIVKSVLGHRILLSYEATIDDIKADQVAMEIAQGQI
ncbi:AAA family ATPase [Halobacteriovorax sp. GB3]|uniref:AAA family ATPase n=1 Tax=Halobacteriovorax sp. GB3 TaxID=2719615 RepID=UPI002360C198|nr:AAA family ATPase [Halobacteriovorax sp. GB3]MDD0854618.1 AAA family ATPase [Halobacteriovorax sp. GB3]